MNATLFAALSIGVRTYLECKSFRQHLMVFLSNEEQWRFILRDLSSEEIFLSTISKRAYFQHSKCLASNEYLVLHLLINISIPLLISLFAAFRSMVLGSLYCGPLRNKDFNSGFCTISRLPLTI